MVWLIALGVTVRGYRGQKDKKTADSEKKIQWNSHLANGGSESNKP